MASVDHCSFCSYYSHQHNSQCCCAYCWKARLPGTQQPPSASASRDVNPITILAACVHAEKPHRCAACVLPPYYRHSVERACENNTDNAARGVATRRVYVCEACQPAQKQQPHPVARAGCGCGPSCRCRRGTYAGYAGELAAAIAIVQFSPHEVPKMGPSATKFAKGEADAERRRYMY